MNKERKLLELIGALIVGISLEESLHKIETSSCFTTLKLSSEETPALYGYRFRKINGETHFIIHEEAAIISNIFEDFLKGIPIPVIHDKARRMGFPRTGHMPSINFWIVASMRD